VRRLLDPEIDAMPEGKPMKQRDDLGRQRTAVEHPRETNHVQKFREDLLLSKAELARRAGVSALTIDRVERGEVCRMDTKRKIILALGLKVQQKDRVFSKKAR
jgi:DNA-binding XRE family transcriptional regulator